MPNPGTISLPLGTSKPLGLSFLSVSDVVVVLELVVELLVVDAVGILRSCTVTDSTEVIGAVGCARTLFGFNGLIGLTGDAGLFKFVAVIMQVSDVVNQAVQVGKEYGSEHVEERFCIIEP
jgi:hypothetical protein